MSLDLFSVARIAAIECDRQQVGLYELARLIDAYAFVREHWVSLYEFGIGHVLQLGAMVDAERSNKLRTTPVTFRNGGTSAPADLVYDLLRDRINNLNHGDCTVEEFIREFLWIHPFEDGNGRVAWILQNWLNKTMDKPDTLKEYRW